MDDLGCAVNYVLSCHCFGVLLLLFRFLLGFLIDSNAAAHFVDSDLVEKSEELCVCTSGIEAVGRGMNRHQ